MNHHNKISEENKKMALIYENLRPKLEGKFNTVTPLVKKIEAPSKKLIQLMFKNQRENCSKQIQEFEKHANIDENFNIKPKLNSKAGHYNTEKSFAEAFECIRNTNPELSKLSNDFAKGNNIITEEYNECSKKCTKLLNEKKNEHDISDCILKCADENIIKSKDFYNDMYDRHNDLISKIEKL